MNPHKHPHKHVYVLYMEQKREMLTSDSDEHVVYHIFVHNMYVFGHCCMQMYK